MYFLHHIKLIQIYNRISAKICRNSKKYIRFRYQKKYFHFLFIITNRFLIFAACFKTANILRN